MKKDLKKAITTIMASLLLISFAVAVGVVVMNLGKAQVEDTAQCPIEVGLKFSNIGGKEQLCYDAAKKQIYFTIENGANIKVEGIIVSVVGTEKAETTELNDAQIIKAGTYLGKINFDITVGGQIRQIKITPKVVLYDVEQICTEKSLVSETIGNC